MKPRHRRLALIALAVALIGGAAALVLNAFQSNMVFFFSPTQIADKVAPQGRDFRIGGMVREGSLVKSGNDLNIRFVITDFAHDVPVTYTGLLPDLFKEGKGVVAQGKLGDDGVFRAEQVLAKHDENYMPPEAAKAMKDAEAAKNKKP